MKIAALNEQGNLVYIIAIKVNSYTRAITVNPKNGNLDLYYLDQLTVIDKEYRD